MNTRKTTICSVGNPGPGLGHTYAHVSGYRRNVPVYKRRKIVSSLNTLLYLLGKATLQVYQLFDGFPWVPRFLKRNILSITIQ
jgi:hypothetical protein